MILELGPRRNDDQAFLASEQLVDGDALPEDSKEERFLSKDTNEVLKTILADEVQRQNSGNM